MNLLEIGESIGIHGFLHCEEAHKLVELAAGKDVLEVGSFRGLSAWLMGISCKSLYCVDTFKANSAGQTQTPGLTSLDDFKHSISRYTNGLVDHFVGTSEQAWHYLETTYDMVFVDAMHDYENVKADINRWLPRVEVGGLFVMHDYGHHDFPGVKKAADEIFGPAPEGTTLITLRWITKT